MRRGPHDARDLGALSRSIAKYGVLQPLLVRPRAGRFDVIAGVRRLAAAAAAGLVGSPVHRSPGGRHARAGAGRGRQPAGAAAGGTSIWRRRTCRRAGLAELSRSFDAIGSCLHLLADRDTALRDRVALDLVRTEVHRAGRLVRCLTALAQDASLSETDVPLASTLEQAIEGFASERRLSGAVITVDAADGPHTLRADHDWLGVALAGAIGGMLALVHGAKSPALSVRVSASGSRASLMIEIAQHAVTVPAWALGRFFDPAWTDRPGGYQAAAELAAARKVAEWHRGGAEVLPGDRGGCRLVLLFPTM